MTFGCGRPIPRALFLRRDAPTPASRKECPRACRRMAWRLRRPLTAARYRPRWAKTMQATLAVGWPFNSKMCTTPSHFDLPSNDSDIRTDWTRRARPPCNRSTAFLNSPISIAIMATRVSDSDGSGLVRAILGADRRAYELCPRTSGSGQANGDSVAHGDCRLNYDAFLRRRPVPVSGTGEGLSSFRTYRAGSVRVKEEVNEVTDKGKRT
jgi:hypothetical protein